jgi:hypothetical protein
MMMMIIMAPVAVHFSETERAYSDNQNAYSETKTPKGNPKLPAVER